MENLTSARFIFGSSVVSTRHTLAHTQTHFYSRTPLQTHTIPLLLLPFYLIVYFFEKPLGGAEELKLKDEKSGDENRDHEQNWKQEVKDNFDEHKGKLKKIKRVWQMFKKGKKGQKHQS